MTSDKSENLSSNRRKEKKHKKVLHKEVQKDQERTFKKLPMAIERFQLPNDQINYKQVFEGEIYEFVKPGIGKVRFREISLLVPMPILDLYNAFISFSHPGFDDALDYFQEMLMNGIYQDFQKHFLEYPKEVALEHIQMLREYFLFQEKNESM